MRGAEAADLDVGVADPRLLRHHGGAGIAAPATGPPRRQTQAVGVLVRGALALGLVRGEKLDVAPGAERVAGAGDDAAIDVRVEADIAPARAQLGIGLAVQRVARLGPVDRHIGDVTLFLAENEFEAGGADSGS